MDDKKVIDVETKKRNEKIEVFKRRAEAVKDIAVESAIIQLQDVRTYQFAAGIGLYQGLKYRGNLGQGIKAGLASIVVFTGCSVVSNLVRNFDNIKNA
jgi:hypothetical protein